MTHKERPPALSANQDEANYRFRFQVNGVTHPDNIIGGAGLIQEITRVSAGVFDIEFSIAYPLLITCFVDSDDTVLDMTGQFTSWTTATRLLRVTTKDLETPAATDPTDDTWVHVDVTFSRRTDLVKSVST